VANTKKETLQRQSDRSDAIRANIKRYYIYVVLALIVFAFSMMKLDQVEFFGRGHFLSPDSVVNIFRSAVPILTVSGAFTLLMISGYIDLSVGSAMSLSAVVFSWLILNGFSFLPSFIITMILGCIMGSLNGYLVMKLRITPVIATLVTLSLFKGIALLIVPNGVSAIKGSAERDMPGWINGYRQHSGSRCLSSSCW
jgi:ribose/xylose/arabinose/galactoside ABC-type transport system permease subunit